MGPNVQLSSAFERSSQLLLPLNFVQYEIKQIVIKISSVLVNCIFSGCFHANSSGDSDQSAVSSPRLRHVGMLQQHTCGRT